MKGGVAPLCFPPSGGADHTLHCKMRSWVCVQSNTLLFSLSGLSALGATWEGDEREMGFFFRGSALQRRAGRLQILDDVNLG